MRIKVQFNLGVWILTLFKIHTIQGQPDVIRYANHPDSKIKDFMKHEVINTWSSKGLVHCGIICERSNDCKGFYMDGTCHLIKAERFNPVYLKKNGNLDIYLPESAANDLSKILL